MQEEQVIKSPSSCLLSASTVSPIGRNPRTSDFTGTRMVYLHLKDEALIFRDCCNDGKYCQVCTLRNVWGSSRWAKNSSFVASLVQQHSIHRVRNHFKETRLSIRIDKFVASIKEYMARNLAATEQKAKVTNCSSSIGSK